MGELRFHEKQMVVTDRWGVALVVRAIKGGTYIIATEQDKSVVFEIADEALILNDYKPPELLLKVWESLYGKPEP